MFFAAYLTLISICGANLPINSWCRTPEHNFLVGGVPTSLHLQCKAMDLGLHRLSKAGKKCVKKESIRLFDRVITYKGHLHVEIH